ncbi:hypothetical protein TNCV_4748281 [Trichonephila clavipes]|nr:hypothetical protein TNCV_4748281 [Trichonephila clavipes]
MLPKQQNKVLVVERIILKKLFIRKIRASKQEASKKELIEREWCMKEVLIVSSYECPECNEQMGLNERKSVVLDGFEWRCRKKGVNTHVCRSIRKRIRGFPIVS